MERTLPHSKFEIETFRIAIRGFSRFALGLFAIVQNRVTEKKAVLIDVREEKEWKQGHLKAAKLLPLSHLERGMSTEKLKEFMPKDKIVYLHCASGARCIEAAELLTDLGFEVRPLKPGYDAFIEAGFEEVIP
jgi:rhodanese-related sulfurtransferase